LIHCSDGTHAIVDLVPLSCISLLMIILQGTTKFALLQVIPISNKTSNVVLATFALKQNVNFLSQ